MVIAITQNEVNSQFARLYGHYINPAISANGLSKAGGVFGGGKLALTSYIRGSINAPVVQLGTQQNPTQALFNFVFQSQPISVGTGGWTQQVLNDAFAKSPDSKNGLAQLTEDIPYQSGGVAKVLSGQPVHYWLSRTQVKIGTITNNQYRLIPALYYVSEGNKTMVSLEGLQLSFQVLLNKIPTTVDEIKKAVNLGILSP